MAHKIIKKFLPISLFFLLLLLVGQFSFAQTRSCVTRPDGLVAWWPLDEATGTIAHDIAGTPEDGTYISNNVLFSNPMPISGKVGGALRFYHGTFVSVPHSPLLNVGTSSFTIDAWVRANAPENGNVYLFIMMKRDNATGIGYNFYLVRNAYTQNKLVPALTIKHPGGYNYYISSPSSIPYDIDDGQWHHVAVVVDTIAHTVNFYEDGLLYDSKLSSIIGNVNLDNNGNVQLGNNSVLASMVNTTSHDLDEVEFFKRALTPDEIQIIYNAGSAGKCKERETPPTPTSTPTSTTPTSTPTSTTPTPPPPGASFDLGDAPDSSNHSGKNMNAYPGVIAKFPTVFDPTTGLPQGPKHLQPKGLAWLGKDVSFENEADLLPDVDGITNIAPIQNLSNRDKFDDGVELPVAIPICGQTQFKYTVTSNATATLYVNAWFDFNRDGDWNDSSGRCTLPPTTTISYPEWAVQNQQINVVPGINTFISPVFGAANPKKANSMWMRITLTDEPINPVNGADGGGPSTGYRNGETEDYPLGIKYTRICGFKFNDRNGNGKRDVGESGLGNWIIEVKDGNGNIMGSVITGANGRYCLLVPSPGKYTVSEKPQSGWIQTAPAGGSYNISVPPAYGNLDFGNKQQPRGTEACFMPPSGLVAWWTMDESNGSSVVNDLAGFNNQGTPAPGSPLGATNAPTSVSGKVNGALKFSPYSQTESGHLIVQDHPEINFGTDSFSIDAWIYARSSLETATSLYPIVDKLEVFKPTFDVAWPIKGYAFYLDNQGTPGARLRLILADGTTSVAYYTGPSVPFDTWVHVGVTVDRSTGKVTFYVNGVPTALTSPSIPSGPIDTPNVPLLIGESRLLPWPQAEIIIDELEMFEGVLSQADIQNIITRGKCKPRGESQNRGKLCVIKFNDLDGDGVKDQNEPQLSGWKFSVTDQNNNPIGTLISGSKADCLNLIAPGSYTITEQVQPGWIPTTPNPQTITLQPGQILNVLFGNKLKVSKPETPEISTQTPSFYEPSGPISTQISTQTPSIFVPPRQVSGEISTQTPSIFTPQPSSTSSPSTTSTQPLQCISPPLNLVGWWPMDGNANDIAGTATNNGILSGSVQFTSPGGGKVGGALYVNGSGSVTVPNHPEISLISVNSAVDLWIKTSWWAPSGYSVGLYSKVPQSNIPSFVPWQGYAFALHSLGNKVVPMFQIVTNSGGQIPVIGHTDHIATNSPNISDNEWHHLAAVTWLAYIFSTQGPGSQPNPIYGVEISIFVDGNLVYQTISHLVHNNFYNSAPAVIANGFVAKDNIPVPGPGYTQEDIPFTGYIDEVEVFNNYLPPQKVKAIYNAGSAGKCK